MQGLSERSLADWVALAETVAAEGPLPGDGELLLHQFVIGVHARGEELTAHELKTLVDGLDTHPDRARDLMSFVPPALALLEAYDRVQGEGDAEETEAELYGDVDGEVEIGPGTLVS